MYLAILGFLEMSFTDILDILLLAILIFILFKWIRGSSAMSIFVAIVSLYFIRILVSAFGMKFMTTLLDTVLDVGVKQSYEDMTEEQKSLCARIKRETAQLKIPKSAMNSDGSTPTAVKVIFATIAVTISPTNMMTMAAQPTLTAVGVEPSEFIALLGIFNCAVSLLILAQRAFCSSVISL